MRFLETKRFISWANKQGLGHHQLKQAALEVTQGIYEADLGGHLFKKRIAKGNRGKSGGVRTIVCLKKHQRIIFLHGFAKNERSNLTRQELKVFKEFANLFLAMSETEIATAINQGDLVEL